MEDGLFESNIKNVGEINLPEFSGTRIMMMPVEFSEPDRIPDYLDHWQSTIQSLIELSDYNQGVGYITIDEAEVQTGETHRRPGIHVDGVSADDASKAGGWGGGGGSWGAQGMLLVSSHVGCQGWDQTFQGWPKAGGDCEHLEEQCDESNCIVMRPNQIYSLNPLAVHEPLPLKDKADTVRRQFVRLSNPNEAPWYEGYTKNTKGIEPAGPIKSRRKEQMSYRK